MDLSNTHLTQASQAKRWIKQIQKIYVFIIFIITEFGENFEEINYSCYF